ncbi:MAG: Trk family potassium uptake protein [Blautia sp.]|nr:Trk family potassium uptake protein [Blautia sp.]MDD7728074.1 potassium transporter TrkG [Clostridia bacterium]MDY5665300.1 potassium transporter TrkG [Blautia sp.]
MNRKKIRKFIPPGKVITLSFGAMILLGALLLMLPVSTRDGKGAAFFDALFTSTSATCVTGLVLHDTWNYWSYFGQFVILLLIQIGGMGVVTMGMAVFSFTGRKIGLRQRYVMQESISAPQMGGIMRLTSFILKATAIFEGTGMLLLAIRFIPKLGFEKGLWFSLFHSVSAFCNAGFDLMGDNSDFSSLTTYSGDVVVNLVVMALIVIGGIGFFVWHDIYTHRLRFKVYRLHTKLVLVTTLILLAVPAFYLFFAEFSRPEWGLGNIRERLLASLFQTVTPRTAGFNTVDLTKALEPTILLLIILMLTGGSPGSTAGGFKTTTLASMLLSVRAVFRNEENIQSFGRRFPSETLRQAAALFILYVSLFLFGGAVICYIDGVPLLSALFETASAIGTVGLSLGLTPTLSMASQSILIFLMFFGRIGGLTMIYAVTKRHAPEVSQKPLEKITVG